MNGVSHEEGKVLVDATRVFIDVATWRVTLEGMLMHVTSSLYRHWSERSM